MSNEQLLREALLVARDHIEMSALELSHPKDADLIRVALAQPADGGEVVAWRYELATYIEGDLRGRGWRWHMTDYKPNVPEGMVRNLRPLTYADKAPPASQEPTQPAIPDKVWVDIAAACDIIGQSGQGAEQLGYALDRLSAAVMGEEAHQCHVYNVTKTGSLCEWEPTAHAFSMPDGKHALYTTPPASKPAEGVEVVDFNAIIEDIEAIETRYRGDPSYDYDPYVIREKAAAVVRRHASIYDAKPARQEHQPNDGWILQEVRFDEAGIPFQFREPQAQFFTTPPASQEQSEPTFVPNTFKLPGESDDDWLDRITGATPAEQAQQPPQKDCATCGNQELSAYSNTCRSCSRRADGSRANWTPQTQVQELPDEREEWRPIKTSRGGRDAVVEFFVNVLKRHDFNDYIKNTLAADFACVLGGYLSAALAAKQERKPMTDEQIMVAEQSSYVEARKPVYSTDHWGDEVTTWEPTKHFNYFVFARAIEAHHGIVEKGVEG